MRIGIINVGASAFRMHIAEYKGDESKTLDFLIKPLRLGTDTFTLGYISLENVKKSTEILRMFKLKLGEYGVMEYRAMCTSGVREAGNKDFFLDYTLLHSGIKLEVLDPSEEIYIKYVGAKNSVPDFDRLEQEGLVFANVASGNVTLNATLKKQLVYSGTLPYGSLRLRQMFRSIPHLKRHKAIEEYVRIMISSVASTLDPDVRLRHLIGAGSSINLMLRLFHLDTDVITLELLQDIYSKVRKMPLNEMSEEMGLRKDEASVLVSTLITYIELLGLVGAKSFTFSRNTFPHTMSLYYSGRITDANLSARIKNTLLSIAKKYRANIKHAKWVNFFARKMFDGFCDLHSLDKSNRQILEAAVILNDVGKYIAEENFADNSYYIIKSIKIPGMDDKMLLMAASIVYEANKKDGVVVPNEYEYISSSDFLTIRKLAAILRVAKALDAGRNRHISDIAIFVSEQIVITADTEREAYLEIYAFDQQKQYFIETFGISIELRARIIYE